MTIQAFQSLDEKCVNTIRMLSIDAVQKANSGHPGLPLDAAPMAYVLWTRFLKHNPHNPKWLNRDRFVLSAGHGSALLYSLLYLTGYDLSLDQIKQFRQWDSKTPGHPERTHTPGVEITTGPLGQGFANGVGMAMAEAYLSARYNRPNFPLIHHYTYGIVSDGDLMEGVAAEAASLAGHLKLGKLIYLYDNNHITLSAATTLAFSENHAKRFESYGWHTITLEDGNDLSAIERAIQEAKEETSRPSLILIRTHIGFGSPNKQDTYEAHGSPLGVEEVKLTKQHFHWPTESPFYIPEDAQAHLREAIKKGEKEEKQWNDLLVSYEKNFPDLAAEFNQLMKNQLPADWSEGIPEFNPDVKGISTRQASGKIMQVIGANVPGFFGGSADLNPSTFTDLKEMGNFQNPSMNHGDRQGEVKGCWNYSGKNIFFGVREHAMGSISNGIATYPGLIPYTATFLTFSDYMRPAIRLAALQELQVIFIFTHDSIALGEDGPTHQPVEHLASLRAIPKLNVIRPCDANETAIAWKVAIETRDCPTTLVFSRQNLPVLDRSLYASAEGLRKGAYILSETKNRKPDIILIATGSEVSLIVAAQKKLESDGIAVRVVSMPCWELFDAQTESYRQSVFPQDISKRLVVESGVSQGWEKYVGINGAMITVNTFGASAPGPIVMEKYGFSIEHVYQQAKELLKRN